MAESVGRKPNQTTDIFMSAMGSQTYPIAHKNMTKKLHGVVVDDSFYGVEYYTEYNIFIWSLNFYGWC